MTATPVEVTADATTFRLSFDTHSGSLNFNPSDIATLDTGAKTVVADRWDGPGAGGHHREGTVTFSGGGDLTDLELHVALDPPISLTWGG